MIMKDDSEIKKHICKKGLINERLTHAFEAERFTIKFIFRIL
jgi:hypothetical protein